MCAGLCFVYKLATCFGGASVTVNPEVEVLSAESRLSALAAGDGPWRVAAVQPST
jgi:hypothetical protein